LGVGVLELPAPVGVEPFPLGRALVMPILAPLADFAGVDRSLVVTIYSSFGGWLSMMMPTNAILMASLVLAKVRFDTYLKWLLPLAGIILGILIVFSVIGALL